MTRTMRLFGLALFLAALAACSAEAAAVPADQLEAQATEEFSQQFPVEEVDCRDDLPAEVGATTQCVLVSDGRSFEMTATVESVDGDDVAYDLELTGEL